MAIGALLAALVLRGYPPILLVAISVTAAAIAVTAMRKRRIGLGLLVMGVATLAARITIAALLAAPVLPLADLAGCTGDWRGEVTDVGAPSGAEQRAFLRLRSDPTCAGDDEAAVLVYARLPRHPPLVPGDRVTVSGRLEARADDGSGFADYLERRGAVGSMRGHTLHLDGRAGGGAAEIERFRWAIDGAISRVLPEPEAGLAAGILIGVRERVSREVADDFTVTGLTHVVAISGWNIALVAGIVTAMLRAWGLRRRLRSFIVLLAIVSYTIVAGAEASVVRAAAMGTVVLLAREGGRPSGAAAALGVACWALLLADPDMIDDIGLQLSLAATAGLLALGGPSTDWVKRRSRGRAPDWFAETLGISLAAQLATLPLILLHFGRLSLISPLANLLVAPVVPFAMLGAVIGLVLAPLLVALPVHLLVLPLTLAAWAPLAMMVRGAEILATVPFANVELVPPLDLALALVALVALVFVLRRRYAAAAGPPTAPPQSPTALARTKPPVRRRPRRSVVALVVVLGVVGSSILLAPPSGLWRVTVLDVGQGDAILLEGPRGTRILVDGGPDPDLLVRRLDERIPIWDRHIDLAILTHPHEDHAGGLAGLAPRYRLDVLAETGLPSESAGIGQLRSSGERLGFQRVRLTQGHRLDFDGARIDVLWPPRHAIGSGSAPTSGRVINDTSVVLYVRIGRQRLLLTGDLEEDKDDELLEVLPVSEARLDLLKVAHHGSATASSAPLLAALRPKAAVVSSGRDNTYGHPAPETLERLRAVDARIHRTDHAGTIEFAFDGQGGSRAPSGGRLSAHERLCRSRPPTATVDPPAGQRCYARLDGGPDAYRGSSTAPVRLALAAAAATRDRRGRSGGFPRTASPKSRPRRRPARCRDRGPPARHRQGPASRTSPSGPWPWTRWRCARE